MHEVEEIGEIGGILHIVERRWNFHLCLPPHTFSQLKKYMQP